MSETLAASIAGFVGQSRPAGARSLPVSKLRWRPAEMVASTIVAALHRAWSSPQSGLEAITWERGS